MAMRELAALGVITLLVGCGEEPADDRPGGGGGGASSTSTTTAGSGGTSTVTTTGTSSSSVGGGGAASQGGSGPGGGGGAGGAGGDEGAGGDDGSGGAGGAGGEGGTCDPVGAGGAGGAGCLPITAPELALTALTPGTSATYRAPLALDLGCGGEPVLVLEVYGPGFDPAYDGGATGTFDLGTGRDADYATCSRCFVAGNQAIGLFQQEGTLVVDPASSQLVDGGLVATVTGLVLVESLFDPATFESTPVPGGACFTLDEAALVVAPPDVPPGWYCADASYDALDGCDCSCGAYDPDCDDPTQAIYFCGEPHFPGDGPSCLPDGTCSNEGGEWTCDDSWYGDGDCDCGCGIQDLDCSYTDDDTECQYCLACDANAIEYACYGVVDPDDTTICLD